MIICAGYLVHQHFNEDVISFIVLYFNFSFSLLNILIIKSQETYRPVFSLNLQLQPELLFIRDANIDE